MKSGFDSSAILALDIGGANLKAADGRGACVSAPFPLWQMPEKLPAALAELAARAPMADRWAISMTGELADCYRTKAEGVRAILAAVMQVAGEREIYVYGVDGAWRTPAEAGAAPLAVAASNWHALAAFCGRFAKREPAVLVDVGSTTCDIVPLRNGRPAARGATDPQRLATGELVYTGVVRSPVCALTPSLVVQGARFRVAQEFFARAQDAWLMLDDLPEDPADLSTPDGRPATREFAHERLARAICADRESFSEEDAREAARQISQAQTALLAQALQQVFASPGERPRTVIVSGQGEFLARRAWDAAEICPGARIVSLAEELGPEASRCAPAHALAVLLAERD